MNEVQEDRWRRRQATRYLSEHPSEWPRLFGIKLLVLWSPAIMPTDLPPHARDAGGAVLLYETPAFRAARTLHLIYFGPLMGFAAIGLFWARRDRAPVGLLLTVPLVITVVYVAFHPSTRYRSPADPFLFILAAYALTRLWQRAPWARSGLSAHPPDKPRVAEIQRP